MADSQLSSEDIAKRLKVAELRVERAKVVMESLAGFCHALGQPATVLLSSIELLKLPSTDAELRNQILDVCYDAAIEIRDLLAKMKEKREYASEAYLPNHTQAGDMLSIPDCHVDKSELSE